MADEPTTPDGSRAQQELRPPANEGLPPADPAAALPAGAADGDLEASVAAGPEVTAVGATDEPVAQAAAEAAPPPAADAAANTEAPRANTLDQAELDALTAQLAQVTGRQKAGVAASTTGSAQSVVAADVGSAAGLTAEVEAASPAGEAGIEPAVLGAAQVAASAADATEFQPPELSGDKQSPQTTAIEMLDDVELDVKIELGRTSMYIEDVLRLGVGAVVELDKLAGDPVDIYVNERLVARGEVLVLNDNFCVRINQIHSPIPELENG